MITYLAVAWWVNYYFLFIEIKSFDCLPGLRILKCFWSLTNWTRVEWYHCVNWWRRRGGREIGRRQRRPQAIGGVDWWNFVCEDEIQNDYVLIIEAISCWHCFQWLWVDVFPNWIESQLWSFARQKNHSFESLIDPPGPDHWSLVSHMVSVHTSATKTKKIIPKRKQITLRSGLGGSRNLRVLSILLL